MASIQTGGGMFAPMMRRSTARRVSWGTLFFLYHNSICGSADGIFSTDETALASWGKYSQIAVIMTNGSEVVPAQYFGNDTPESVFVPWSMVKGELWPGEY